MLLLSRDTSHDMCSRWSAHSSGVWDMASMPGMAFLWFFISGGWVELLEDLFLDLCKYFTAMFPTVLGPNDLSWSTWYL